MFAKAKSKLQIKDLSGAIKLFASILDECDPYFIEAKFYLAVSLLD